MPKVRQNPDAGRGRSRRHQEVKLSDRRYRKWKAGVMDQRGHLCERCLPRAPPYVQGKQLHHIRPRYLHPELAMDEDNVILLCEPCHLEVERLIDTGENPYSYPREWSPHDGLSGFAAEDISHPFET